MNLLRLYQNFPSKFVDKIRSLQINKFHLISPEDLNSANDLIFSKIKMKYKMQVS